LVAVFTVTLKVVIDWVDKYFLQPTQFISRFWNALQAHEHIDDEFVIPKQMLNETACKLKLCTSVIFIRDIGMVSSLRLY